MRVEPRGMCGVKMEVNRVKACDEHDGILSNTAREPWLYQLGSRVRRSDDDEMLRPINESVICRTRAQA